MVVETCPASAVSAILIRRNCGGPWLEDGPRELGKKPSELPNMEPIPALVAIPLISVGGMRPVP